MKHSASILIILAFAGFIHAQTTQFTYQGRLTDGVLPANGSYQMQFSLFDAEEDGTQIGETITIASVTVTQGVFTVTLNIAASDAFNGGPRWLAIAVKRAADPGYTPLNPRQPVSSTPYAIKSRNADTADVANNSTQLGGVDANQYVLTGDTRLSDERAPTAGSENYIQNRSDTQPSSNFSISGSGFVAGSLGVGTLAPNPDAKFEVSGSGFVRARVNSDFNGGFALALNNQPKWSIATAGAGQFQIFNDAIVQNAVWIDPTNNNFGIGTFTPGSKLDVGGAINTATQYNIGGNRILSTPGLGNLFAGLDAGASNSSGQSNAFFGASAGKLNTIGNGNTYLGVAAGENSTGGGNSIVGATAGRFATGANSAYFGAGSGRASAADPNTGAFNAFFGYQSGMVNTSGNLNSFFGSGAGIANTTGFQNSFFGGSSGAANENGIGNSFFGMSSGDSNTSGSQNAFFGANSGTGNTSGNHNVFLGNAAGISNSTGHRNTFLGTASGQSITTGVNNTGLGFRANVGVGGLAFATAIGSHAVVGASDTIVIGKVAGTYDGVARPADTVQIPGDLTVAGAINGTVLNATNAVNATTANNALSLGGVAANQYVQTTDPRMTDARIPLPLSNHYIQNIEILGSPSPQALSSFSITGNGTLGGTLNANSVNTATQFNISGSRALAVSGPYNDGLATFYAASNTFAGFNAGESTTPDPSDTNHFGKLNSFFGASAGKANTTGFFNSFFGFDAGASNVNGNNNSFLGQSAGFRNAGGTSNTFLGRLSGSHNLDGNSNTAVGENADFAANNATGSSNTQIGSNTRIAANTSFQTAIGTLSRADAENSTAIGFRARATQSNSMVLGSINGVNGATADTNVGIGTTAPATKLHVSSPGVVRVRINSDSNAGLALTLNNTGGWSVANANGGEFVIFNDGIIQPALAIDAATNFIRINSLGAAGGSPLCRNASNEIAFCSSSGRYKNNINGFTPGLNLISRLRPVSFTWKQGGLVDMGLVAEDVAKIEPLLVTHNEKGEVEGVKYDRIGVVLINVVKEQQAQIDKQQKEIENLKKIVCELKPSAGICKEE